MMMVDVIRGFVLAVTLFVGSALTWIHVSAFCEAVREGVL